MPRRKQPKKPKRRTAHPRLSLSRAVDTRVIYCGDNDAVLRELPDACVDLIYIDPPFYSGRNYEVLWGEDWERRAFEDRHESMSEYLRFLEPRCRQLARVLKPTGTFYFHCDWHANHRIRILLDSILDASNFLNEIVWKRQSSHGDAAQGAKHYARVHDTLLVYTGGDPAYTFNHQYLGYSNEYIEKHYRHTEKETGRRYSLGDITAPGGAAPSKGNPRYEFLGVTRYWRFSRENMMKLHKEGRIVQSRPGAVPRQKRYLDEARGVPLSTVWDGIQPVHGSNRERVGYPTQKPLELLERIIKTSSNPGDVVLDAFCGCGTTLEAAERLERQWIGIDFSPTACKIMADRLEERCSIKQNEALWHADRGFVVKGMPMTADHLREMDPFDFQNWAIIALNGYPNKKKVRDLGIDGKLYPANAIMGAGKGAAGKQLEFTLDMYYPVQAKQTKVGRPDIDNFETAMRRVDAHRGYVVGFDFTSDAVKEIERFERHEGRVIIHVRVEEILRVQAAERAKALG